MNIQEFNEKLSELIGIARKEIPTNTLIGALQATCFYILYQEAR